MRFEKKLKTCSKKQIWEEYCGFLHLSEQNYMAIQESLLLEQIRLLSGCALGKRFFGDTVPGSMEEFRHRVPLTTYDDYTDILLTKREDLLPAKPAVWLKTTWESGLKPDKWAPYSEAMLEAYRRNITAAMILSTSRGEGDFRVRPGYRCLFALAPLPYATGLFPDLIAPEIRLNFLPPVEEARKMSYGAQQRRGFALAAARGMDMFFGLSSVLYSFGRSFSEGTHKGSGKTKLPAMSLPQLFRTVRASVICRRDNRALLPGDLFRLKGFVCVGTDTDLYKQELERVWGLRPLEVMGGTEPSCMATETWSKNGLCFFPDANFYEFIPEEEMRRNLQDPSYVPRTYLLNELSEGRDYELVITSLKGGAFLRYRPGDVYRCVRRENPEDGIHLPQLRYIDRTPNVIDIAGFTRFTERSLSKVLELSGLHFSDWAALKKYDAENRSYMQLYAELQDENPAQVDEVLKNHVNAYFRFFDQDYRDVKDLLGTDPLNVTVLPAGTLAEAGKMLGRRIPRINMSHQDEIEVLKKAKDK